METSMFYQELLTALKSIATGLSKIYGKLNEIELHFADIENHLRRL